MKAKRKIEIEVKPWMIGTILWTCIFLLVFNVILCMRMNRLSAIQKRHDISFVEHKTLAQGWYKLSKLHSEFMDEFFQRFKIPYKIVSYKNATRNIGGGK